MIFQRFEGGWPAIAHESKGVIFVISPDHRAPEKELENWFVRFVTPYGIKESSCVIFAHSTTGGIVQQKFKTKLSNIAYLFLAKSYKLEDLLKLLL